MAAGHDVVAEDFAPAIERFVEVTMVEARS